MYLIVKESPTSDLEVVAKKKNRTEVVEWDKLTPQFQKSSCMVIKADSLADFVAKNT